MSPTRPHPLRRAVRLRRLAGTLVAVAALLASPARSQEAGPPVLHEGDRWVFVQRDGFTHLELSTSSLQVGAVLPDGYEVEWNRPGGPDKRVMTLDLNTRQVIDGVPGDTAELRFPLAVGKRWTAVVAFRNPNSNASGVLELEREVIGQEVRKTPVGDLQTWKIVAKGRWVLKSDPNKVATTDFHGRYETTCWFSPAAKTCAAQEVRSFAKGHVGNWYRYELVQLELH